MPPVAETLTLQKIRIWLWFATVRMKKPLASRARSAEMYLLATGRRIL